MDLFDRAPAGDSWIVSVAVPRPLNSLFTYKIPNEMLPYAQLGTWVKVPFRSSMTRGFIAEPPKPISTLPSTIAINRLKSIEDIGREGPALTQDILALCRWAHEYYCVPLGEVFTGAAPQATDALAHGVSKKRKLKSKVNPPQNVQPLRRASSDVFGNAFVEAFVLTEDQRNAIAHFEKLRNEKAKVGLLQGVTGSGKTAVYIELAKKTLALGQGVLILVPEIALTSQLHRRFEEGLGVTVGIWHSAVSAGKRRNEMQAMRSGEIRVVVGARSAVFAPIHDLGLIVIDEEHDPTYKQEDRIRYHARDLAIVRAKLAQAVVVLGSATPSLETRERVLENRYSKVELPKRIAEGGMPQIEMVDLAEEEMVDTQAPLARKTLQAIQETVLAGDQVIIYLNRRGYAAFLLCKDCGQVQGCDHCSISLTVHKFRSELRCHLCGHREAIPDVCNKCQGLHLMPMGAGTESLETELPPLVPEARVIRLDRDQITSTKRLDQILDHFRRGDSNILLGTQMLVKGHDFPNVTLVVVVLADALFRWPDFRAAERALQVLKQVSGRAGRGTKPGKVLIQTFDPDHAVLQVVDGRMSEDSFHETERELRQVLGYPPFGRLARFRFESSSRETAVEHATGLAEQLKVDFAEALNPLKFSLTTAERVLELLGPSEAFLEKIKGIYRWDLLLKAKDIRTLHKAVLFSQNYCVKYKWQYSVDIDPYGV